MRRLLRLLPAVALTLFLVWASTPLWRITPYLPDRLAWLVPAAQAVFAVGVLGALLCLLLVCWRGGRRRTLWTPALASLVSVAVIVPVGIVTTQAGERPAGQDAPSGTVRVMALNTFFGRADDAAISAEANRIAPDVLVLAETSPDEVAAVEELTGMVATAPVRDEGRASGTAVLVRDSEVPEQVTEDVGLSGHQTPSVRLSAPVPVDVLGVHTRPPAYSDLIGGWERDLARMRDSFHDGDVPLDVPLVLAGDFNATVAHPEFRDVLGQVGLEKCGGNLGERSWPDRFPLVRIDHVLVRGGTCGDGGTVRVEGTDHRGVWADVSV